jgi:lipoprotein-anchoring transpeptidase ErfK/SrfK
MKGSLAVLLLVASALTALCDPTPDFGPSIFISAHDQKLAVVEKGEVVAKYPISTSKYGLGDSQGSYKTPLGNLWVSNKIGDNLPLGAVIRHRSATGEVLAPNAPGRDPIVTRVIWLSGLEAQNKNAYGRCIYIHGTPEERNLGKPSSYGCIRMRSKDVVDVYKLVRVGTRITISEKSLSSLIPSERRGWFTGVAVLQ